MKTVELKAQFIIVTIVMWSISRKLPISFSVVLLLKHSVFPVMFICGHVFIEDGPLPPLGTRSF
jgi:hypothetical protein